VRSASGGRRVAAGSGAASAVATGVFDTCSTLTHGGAAPLPHRHRGAAVTPP
jgi:hypothetical protein